MELMTKMTTLSLSLMLHETKWWMVGQGMYLTTPCVRSTAKHSWHWHSPPKRMTKKRNMRILKQRVPPSQHVVQKRNMNTSSMWLGIGRRARTFVKWRKVRTRIGSYDSVGSIRLVRSTNISSSWSISRLQDRQKAVKC